MTSITGRARRYFERVETEEEPYYAAQQVERQRPTNIIDDNNTTVDDDDDDGDDGDDGDGDEVATTTTTIEIPLAIAVDDEEEEELEVEQPEQELEVEQLELEQELEDEHQNQNQNQIMFNTSSSSQSLEELEIARDEAIQQSSVSIMTGSYILMMLWLQVFATYDMTLFLISLGLSSLFVRYIEYAQQNIDTLNQLVITFTNENGTTTRSGRRRTSGVDEIVKQQWDTFTFNSRASLAKKENFGTCKSLFTIDDDDDDDDEDYDDKLKIKIVDDDKDDEDDTPSYQHEHQQHHHQTDSTDTDTLDIHHPECSICLGEYEKGDKLISLNPCHHIFHDECITSWTNHNIRCPLCNVDLVQVQEQEQVVLVVAVDDMV